MVFRIFDSALQLILN